MLSRTLRRRWSLMKHILLRKWQYPTAILIVFCLLVIFLRPRQKTIPLYVVEEHHEVLPYWFKAAADGLIPKSGNTLIHIDGHSDQALPSYADTSFFKWPATHSVIKSMMQKNDVFIQGAAMAGLISRFIFIWPSWDTEETERPPELTFKMVMGWLEGNFSGGMAYCSCMIDPNGDTECTDEESDWKKGWKCRRMRSYMSEYVIDYAALQKLLKGKPGKWPQNHGGVILDIDEDYFGCELAATPLLEAGVKWELVDKLSLLIEPLLCPTRIEHEGWANEMLRAVFSAVITACRHMTRDGHCVMSEKEANAVMAPVVKKYRRKYPSLSCAVGPVSKTWRGIAKALLAMRRRDIKAIVDLGFCLTQTTETYNGDRGATAINVCVGANTPNRTIVFAHTGTESEVESRMSDLSIMIQKLHAHENTRPKIVTLCRSVRDGFTPRRQFAKIESGILNIFANKLGKDVQYDVSYDPNLLGGMIGWSNRHSILPPQRDNKL